MRAADGAAARDRKDLLPHVEVARHALRGPAASRRAAAGRARACARRSSAARGSRRPGAARGRKASSRSMRQWWMRPVRVDPERQRVGEVALGEKRLDRLDVVRQPEVVVGEVADDLASSLAQRRVPVLLPVARPLRVVEEPHARIGRGQLGHQLARDVRGAVADNEHLQVGDRLLERARDRAPERRAVVVRRDEDGRGEHHAGDAGQGSQLRDRPHGRGSLGGAAPRRRAAVEVLEKGAQLPQERQLGGDGSQLGLGRGLSRWAPSRLKIWTWSL